MKQTKMYKYKIMLCNNALETPYDWISNTRGKTYRPVKSHGVIQIDFNFKMKAINPQNRVRYCYNLGNLCGCKFVSINLNFESLYDSFILLYI